jgi:hypothetical protein
MVSKMTMGIPTGARRVPRQRRRGAPALRWFGALRALCVTSLAWHCYPHVSGARTVVSLELSQ